MWFILRRLDAFEDFIGVLEGADMDEKDFPVRSSTTISG